MSESEQGNGNGNGRGDGTAVARRIEALEPHPYLLAKGFPEHRIQQAGWRVEKLGERYLRFRLPEGAADCDVWLIPYLHWNGQVWFERARFVNEEDFARFGQHPESGNRWLYDPFLVLSTENPEPRDAVLLVEGEANTIAADILVPAFGALGIAEGWSLSAQMASFLGHIPCVYVWLDRQRYEATDRIHWIADRLREAGVAEIRQLPVAPMTAEEALRELGAEKAAEAAGELIAKAELLEERTDEDWPLMPRQVPPRFPVDALPEAMGAFVSAVATRSRTPPDMAAMGALGVLATVAMGASIDCGDWEEEALALYILVISPSGDHKSTVLKAVAGPLYRMESEAREEWREVDASRDTQKQMLEARKRTLIGKAAKLETDEEWAATQADLEEVSANLKEATEAAEPQLLTDDATPEGLAKLMAKHPNGIAVASAEAAIVNNLLGHYSDQGKANLFVVCKAFNGEGPVSVDRGGAERLFIPRPLLTLTLFAQPHVLRKVLANETARDQGLIGRFVYADLEPASALVHHDYTQRQPKVPSHLQEAWLSTVKRVKAACAPPNPPQDNKSSVSGGFGGFGGASDVRGTTLSLSLPAHSLLIELMNRLAPRTRDGGDLVAFRDWVARHHGRVARIAGLLHLTEHPPERDIDAPTMRSAVAIGEFLLEHMIITRSAPDPRVRRAMSYLAEKGIDRLTLRDLHRMPPLNKRVPVAEARELAELLMHIGALRPITDGESSGPKGGRPKGPRYEVNPHLRSPRT